MIQEKVKDIINKLNSEIQYFIAEPSRKEFKFIHKMEVVNIDLPNINTIKLDGSISDLVTLLVSEFDRSIDLKHLKQHYTQYIEVKSIDIEPIHYCKFIVIIVKCVKK